MKVKMSTHARLAILCSPVHEVPIDGARIGRKFVMNPKDHGQYDESIVTSCRGRLPPCRKPAHAAVARRTRIVISFAQQFFSAFVPNASVRNRAASAENVILFRDGSD